MTEFHFKVVTHLVDTHINRPITDVSGIAQERQMAQLRLARCLGIGYFDLIPIKKTHFLNPKSRKSCQ